MSPKRRLLIMDGRSLCISASWELSLHDYLMFMEGEIAILFGLRLAPFFQLFYYTLLDHLMLPDGSLAALTVSTKAGS